MGNMVTKNPVERIARIMPPSPEAEAAAPQEGAENALPTSVEPQLPPAPAPSPEAPAEAVSPATPEVGTPPEDFTQMDLNLPEG